MSRGVRAGQVRVYLGGRVIRVISRDRAAKLLNDGRATDVWRGDDFAGVELSKTGTEVADARAAACGSAKMAGLIAARVEVRASVKEQDASKPVKVLTKYEAAAVAECHPSRTEGMSFTDPRRDRRVAAGLSEMDAAEAARVKFDAMFGGGKAKRPNNALKVAQPAARLQKRERPEWATYSVLNDPEALANVVVV